MNKLSAEAKKSPDFKYDGYSLDGTFRSTISKDMDIPYMYLTDGTLLSSGWVGNGRMDI